MFRMLLGRNTLKIKAVVDSSVSYRVGKNPKKLKKPNDSKLAKTR